MDLQKIAKRKSVTSALRCFFSHFGMNVVIFLFTSMHVLNFMIWICVLCFNIFDDHMAQFYYFMISSKEIP